MYIIIIIIITLFKKNEQIKQSGQDFGDLDYYLNVGSTNEKLKTI